MSIKRKAYTSIYETADVYQEPWTERVEIDGTDGMQFHPLLTKEERISAFVNDISRNAYFTYVNSDFNTYNGLEMMTF